MFHLEQTANSVYSINSEYLLKMCARASTSLPLPKNQPDTRQNETEGVIERGKKINNRYPKSSHHAIPKEGRWRRRRIRISSEHPITETIRTDALRTFLAPMSAATASIALFGVSHARPLSNPARRHLHFHRLTVDHRPVQLFDCLVHVTG